MVTAAPFHLLLHTDDSEWQVYACMHRIRNQSSVAVQYSWRQYATADEEGASAAASMINRASQGSIHLEGDVTDIMSEEQPAGNIMCHAPRADMHKSTSVFITIFYQS